MANLLSKIFGNKHERDISRIKPIVQEINDIYQNLHLLSNQSLRDKTGEFKTTIKAATEEIRQDLENLRNQMRADTAEESEGGVVMDMEALRNRIQALEQEEIEVLKNTLDEILPEAFAVVKETCRRLKGQRWKVCDQDITWDMIPYDVQLIGGIVLHEGKIAEMATGEGKTLVATMPIYLNALAEKGVHLVTVNDYLARRDAEWMGKIYEFLGLTVRFLQNDMDSEARREVYNSDITYGTNNEFGFDYLRDNMAIRREDMVQRGHFYAIVDEVDSVLVDEARTPLIISGPVEHSTHQFHEVRPLVDKIVRLQTGLTNKIIAEAEKLLEENKEYEAGIKLLQSLRGAPKNKRLTKLMNEVGIKKLIRRVENDYLRDKKMHEIDEVLYYVIDEKSNVIDLTEIGREALSPNDPDAFVLPDLSIRSHEIDNDPILSESDKAHKRENLQREFNEKNERLHNILQLLRAYSLFEKDVEYVVTDDKKVMIVDEFTGRLMPGRRYSDGLHQAIEAKEGVAIERETQTLATITLQNYFRMYRKLAGMTGTAETESGEFWQIYKLDVVVIPTNQPIRRIDCDDEIYRTKREKYNAVIEEIVRLHEAKIPVLVGTISVDASETLSRMLTRQKIRHEVLNAKYHQREAEIVARAGQPGAVTIATNMAGRGTDIKLGAGVVKHNNCALLNPRKEDEACPYARELKCHDDVPCGLHILGTERHEARRIDRQLRGRSGRQGDPGSSRFYMSLEDDLMRLFGSDRVAGVMDRLGVEDGEVITHPMVSKSIERAQKRVENHNFDIRKHLLEYDDVMNKQRETIYKRRSYALSGENLREDISEMIKDFASLCVEKYTTEDGYLDSWDWTGLRDHYRKIILAELPDPDDIGVSTQKQLYEYLNESIEKAYKTKESWVGERLMRELERLVLLRVIDEQWRDHLFGIDVLKEGIGLRAYGQKDPLIEYKSEGFKMFEEMLTRISEETIKMIFHVQVQKDQPLQHGQRRPRQMQTMHASAEGMGFSAARSGGVREPEPVGKVKPVRVEQKIGRNDPCPCGSGKKFKKCHGQDL